MEAQSNPDLILIADDDPGDRMLIRRALSAESFGKNIVTVRDGEEALDYLLRRDKYSNLADLPLPNLLILDLNMPRIDGMQVLQAMSENNALRMVPVVIFSTSDQCADVQESYGHGAWYYIVKPAGIAGFEKMVGVLRHFWERLHATK